jgi:putative aminopeptidase FrvX
MAETLAFLKSLMSVPGLSGYEEPAARLIEAEWRPLVDELSRSRLGSLHGLRRGSGAEPRPSLLIATHMDAIGMMVSQVVDGFIRLAQIGGIDARVLPGTPVTVHGTEDLAGVAVLPPARLLPPSVGDGSVPLDQLWVDVGLLPRQVSAKVRVGDLVSFASVPTELSGDVISGHSLDNRASVAALTIALEELKTRTHAWDVWAVATAQEEVTLGGGATSAFSLTPSLAVAVDVTFGKGPGANDWSTHPLGSGPGLGFGPNIHPSLHRKFKALAEKLEIPHELDPIPRHSGTDSYTMQVAREGIPTMVVSIPLRYMHTPVEMVVVKDIRRTGRLLAEFIAALEPDFVSQITWDNG